MKEFISNTGNIKLYNADCMEIMASYPDKYFDLAVVDPPYGINITAECMGGRKTVKKNNSKKWDIAAPKKEYFTELFRISKNQIIWGGNYFELPPSRYFAIWDKGETMYGRDFAECEYAWIRIGGTRIFKKNPNQLDRIHETQKPKALYNWIFKNYATPEMKILDTHLGSASSAIAAHYFGFSEFIGCEIDSEYFEKSIIRFKHETAQLKLF